MKCTLIFAIVVGGLIFALNAESIFTSSGDNFPDEDKIDIKELCDDIRKEWDEASGWDEELYQNRKDDIEQSKGINLFSMTDYNTVKNTLRESSTNKACDSYIHELHNDVFSDANLQKAYKGVQAVKKHEELNNDPRVKEVEERHNLYTKIKSFVNGGHYVSAKFDTENTSWVSFTAKKSSILATAKKYRTNKIFIGEMQKIPGFVAGLEESEVASKVDAQKTRFYDALATQIEAHYTSLIPSAESVASFGSVLGKFANEANNSTITAKVATCYENHLQQFNSNNK